MFEDAANAAPDFNQNDADLLDSCSEADSAISLSYNLAPTRHSSGNYQLSTSNRSELANTTTFSVTNPSCSASSGGNRFHILDRHQVSRLCEVMEREICIDARPNAVGSASSKSNPPSIKFCLKTFLSKIHEKFKKTKLNVLKMRLNGGAATHVIYDASHTKLYNDIDIIFEIAATNDNAFEEAKVLVFETLFEFLPPLNSPVQEAINVPVNEPEQNCAPKNTPWLISKNWPYRDSFKDAYVKKMIKVMNETDKWSLISLSNDAGRNLELKFVERIRRQYEFTVDSFQIILDSLMRFFESKREMTQHYYPTIAAESVYGNFDEALQHLRDKTIFTRNPEEIRGGGLLRYCRLLSEGYRCAADQLDVQHMQQLMCSRFFIDFGSLAGQEAKLRGYLDSHFPSGNNKIAKYRYLLSLYQVVSENTICLMTQEMQQILSLIFCLAQQVLLEIQQTEVFKYLSSSQFACSTRNFHTQREREEEFHDDSGSKNSHAMPAVMHFNGPNYTGYSGFRSNGCNAQKACGSANFAPVLRKNYGCSTFSGFSGHNGELRYKTAPVQGNDDYHSMSRDFNIPQNKQVVKNFSNNSSVYGNRIIDRKLPVRQALTQDNDASKIHNNCNSNYHYGHDLQHK